jgi:hypothetical protein
MGYPKHRIGWCLLAVSSLMWLGCDQLALRRPPGLASAQSPEAAAPLQIADTTPPAAGTLIRASLQAPSPIVDERLEPVPVTTGPPTAAVAASPLRRLHRLAAERFAATPAYFASLRRRETVDGSQRPEEWILFKYRKEPSSIYMRWLGNEARGREVLYVKGQFDDMIHVLPGSNETGIFQFTSRAVVRRPDSPQGLGKERCAVAEVGVGPWINRFGRLVEAFERGDPKAGTVKYLGSVRRPEFETPVEAVMHLIPSGFENGLPHGGQRLWFFDATLHFPVLLIAHDANGQEVEYYCLERIVFPAHVQESEFDPGSLGKH